VAAALGVLSATHRGGWLDHASRLASLFLQSMPAFWLGIMLILLFAVELGGLLPAYGSGTVRHLILPAVTLAAAPLAQNVRLIRSGMLECSGRTTCAPRGPGAVVRRGLPARARNAALPVLSVTGLSWACTGQGHHHRDSILWPAGPADHPGGAGRDFVIQAGVFVFAVIFVALNLVVDILYSELDPRVRLT
jgi:peptide/nickel transport system permease protein